LVVLLTTVKVTKSAKVELSAECWIFTVMFPLRVFTGTDRKPAPPLVVARVLSTPVPFPVAVTAEPEERIFPCSTASVDWNSALAWTISAMALETS
jgi:hypothetical protein